MYTRKLTEVLFTFFLVQTIKAQWIGKAPNPCSVPFENKPVPFLPESIIGGGSFSVRSKSPIAPTGVSVHSDKLVIEGPLVIDGQLPFLGTVAVEGELPAVGSGNVAHSCGSTIGITEITPVAGPLFGTTLPPPSFGNPCRHLH